MKKEKEENFNAVEFMRKRRDELSKEYTDNPIAFKKELEEIRKKYAHLFNTKQKKAA